MSSTRKIAVVAGGFFLLAAAASIPALAAIPDGTQRPRLRARYRCGHRRAPGWAARGPHRDRRWPAPSVALYPVVKRQNQGAAARLRLGRAAGGRRHLGRPRQRPSRSSRCDRRAAAAAGRTTARSSSPRRRWSPCTTGRSCSGPTSPWEVNTLLLAWLMHRSGLVLRWIAVLGLTGGALIFASATAVLFGLYDQISAMGTIAALPVFAWEMSLAVYLIAKGFRPFPAPRARRGPPGGPPGSHDGA